MSDAPKLVVHCYPWYIADWLQSEHVAAMSLEERGLYREALDLCYANGSIPDNPVALQKLTRSTEKEFRRAWPKVRACFYQDGDRLCNEKVNAVLEKERVRRDRARESGSAGGRAKAQKTKQEPSEQPSKEGSRIVATLRKKPSEIVAPHPHPPPHPPPQPHPLGEGGGEASESPPPEKRPAPAPPPREPPDWNSPDVSEIARKLVDKLLPKHWCVSNRRDSIGQVERVLVSATNPETYADEIAASHTARIAYIARHPEDKRAKRQAFEYWIADGNYLHPVPAEIAQELQVSSEGW